ncbi:GNAT family N-acetyltransferase [Streptomyces tagetis]|uniref:GNAT family N-acetyltransferase n=1 Tax=Streptomyces tagetis TaxID=2820809 RepID=A0A941B4T0_9ACTN|nr:GNAT family N-acetyltransferase [Streptomyces sp. RG38]MBQ0829527.1 GNAT family N-acetyltransferase [Streptomyces sp. RG38]
MRLHWGWIEPVMPVPYVPTLGPARWDDPLHELLEAVVDSAGTGRFLPHDKDRRWAETKAERVLVDAIEHGQAQTFVPTLAERGRGVVKVHVYGAPDSLSAGADLARKLAPAHGAAKARIVWFLGPDQPDAYAQGTRVQLKDFTAGPGDAPGVPVQEYKELPEDAGFQAFAMAMAEDGFAFLYGQMQAGTVGPVLTVLHDGLVAGAIGPMETMNDARGYARLLPQYFGVLPRHRGRGYGRALWRAAMHWGHQHGAAYQLLQTEVGGASDRLCRAEGLASLGFVNQADV